MNFNLLAKRQAAMEFADAQKELSIKFKRVFGSPEGRELMLELMNKFHIITPHRGETFDEGQRSVVLWMMEQTHMNLAELDRLMRGETA